MHTDAAPCYDRLASDPRWHGFTVAERRKVSAFLNRWRIKPGDSVLEPGCGSGRLTEVLAGLTGPTGRVLAFDVSPEFTRLAAQRGLPAHVTLRTARAETLPLAPESFDHVVCFNVFPHLVPAADIVRRFAAALRPGGKLWIAHTRSRAWVNRIHRSGPRALHHHLIPESRMLRRLLREAGLRVLGVSDQRDHFHARAVRPGLDGGAGGRHS